MVTTQTNKDQFRRVFDALNERNIDAFAAIHADDVGIQDHAEEIHGVEPTIEHGRALHEALPDMEYTVEWLYFDSRHAINVFSLVRRKDERHEFGVGVFR